MEHLQSAQQQMKELEAALSKATSSGGDPDTLRAAQAAMKGLEAHLSQATAAMGLDDASTTAGAPTPGTSVAGDTSDAGPDLAVKPSANGVHKLSLQARKNIRDEFESKKEELATGISALMKQPWTVHVDTANVLSYAEESSAKENPGGMFYNFFSGALNELERWLKKTGEDGRNALNSATQYHVITLEPAEAKDAPTTSCDIKGGRLRMTFRQDSLGWNAGYCLAGDNISQALNSEDMKDGAGTSKPAKLPFATRLNIRDEYEKEIPPTLEAARKSLHRPDLTFTPNFAENFAFMKSWIAANQDEARNVNEGWEAFLGARTKDYFQGFTDYLANNKFEADDMLREGFFDACEKADVQLRIVDKKKMKGGNSSETQVQDGVCYLQTTPDGWGWSPSNASHNLLDVL